MFDNWYTRDILALTAIIISISTGILWPIVKLVHKRYFQKSVLECFLNKNMDLSYDGTAGLFCILTIISKKCDNVITDVGVRIFKGENNKSQIYQMKWWLLSSVNRKTTYADWGFSSTDRESMSPCPMYLTRNVPLSYCIHFDDEKLSKENQMTLLNQDANYIKDTILTNMNYEEGLHTLELDITDFDKNIKTFRYSFSLSKDEVDILKYNATIVTSNIGKPQNEKLSTRPIQVELTIL